MALNPLQRLPPRAGTVDQRPLSLKRLTVNVMPNELQRRLGFQELLPHDIAAPLLGLALLEPEAAGGGWSCMKMDKPLFRLGLHGVVELASGLPAMVL